MIRKMIGWAVLTLGTAALGIWASFVDAARIESQVRTAAQQALQSAAAGDAITLDVSGRDITLSGMATNEGGSSALIAALDQTSGRREVRANLTDLPVAKPYLMTVTKTGSGMTVSGHVPSDAMRARLSAVIGDVAGDLGAALDLAAGAPDGWETNANAGLAALAQLESGTLRLEGQSVILQGQAKSPNQARAASDALSNVALLIKDITLQDDGLPIAYAIDFNAEAGATVRGKLPFGISLGSIATALALPKIAGDAKTAQAGAAGDISYLATWAAALPQIETLSAEITPEARKVTAKLLAGADAAAIASALAIGGFDVTLQAAPEPTSEPTPEPIGPLLSPLGFEISQAGCQGASDALLAATTIIFLPNESTLDAASAAALAELAAIARDCTGANLRAEIGGHTDTSGNQDENLALSARRADTVRDALIAAGVPAAALTATGFGDAQPIADNATKEGRIQNRRTTVVWSQ